MKNKIAKLIPIVIIAAVVTLGIRDCRRAEQETREAYRQLGAAEQQLKDTTNWNKLYYELQRK